MAGDTYERVFRVVRRIPRGRVATYGQIAALAGLRNGARRVGYALNALRDQTIPWHRVINAAGRISARREPGADLVQRVLLEAEGLRFGESGSIDLKKHQWKPRD